MANSYGYKLTPFRGNQDHNGDKKDVHSEVGNWPFGLNSRSEYDQLCGDADFAQELSNGGSETEKIQSYLDIGARNRKLRAQARITRRQLQGNSKRVTFEGPGEMDGPDRSKALAILNSNGIYQAFPTGYCNRKKSSLWMQLSGLCPLHLRTHANNHPYLTIFKDSKKVMLYCQAQPRCKRALLDSTKDALSLEKHALLTEIEKTLEKDFQDTLDSL